MTDQPTENPFPVSDQFKLITPALTNALIESLAFVSVPAMGETPVALVTAFADHWAVRVTGFGGEDACYAAVWELSAQIGRLAEGGVPFTPFDIVSGCGDDDCEADHAGQTRAINEFFAAATSGDHTGAVKAYTKHVRMSEVEDWKRARVLMLSTLIVHTSVRVSEFRSNSVEELPSLD